MRIQSKFQAALAVVFSVLLTVIFVGESAARPAICGKLERQLASSETTSTSGSSKFARAARAQNEQLRIARGQAQNAGCSGRVRSLNSNTNMAVCARINSTIRRMEANLSKLQSKAVGGATKPNRARILAALDANDCNGRVINDTIAKRKLPAAKKAKEEGFLTILFGGNKQPKRIETAYEVASIQSIKPGQASKKEKKIVTVVSGGNADSKVSMLPSGGFRTLCVRTCDGYYFPVSFSTSSSRFSSDAKVCAAMCPGAETKLYYHSVPDQEPEEMVDLDRQPYSAMPTAFKYRRDGMKSVPGCTCQAAATGEQEEVVDASGSQKTSKWIPYPSFKPVMLEDEETRINRSGELDGAAIRALLDVKLGNQSLASQQNVRVVGPVFLPAQSKAADLPALDRSSVQ